MSNATGFNQRLINLCQDTQFRFRKKTPKISGNSIKKCISIFFNNYYKMNTSGVDCITIILSISKKVDISIAFRDAEEQAEKIALEIESQPAYKERTDVENGDENEEAKFAAVERPQSSSPDEIKVGKYVAPGRRKQHNTQAGKLIRPSQINNNSNISSTSVPIGLSQQNTSNKYSTLVSHSMSSQQQTMQKNSGTYRKINGLEGQQNIQYFDLS